MSSSADLTREDMRWVAHKMLEPAEANGVVAYSFMSKSMPDGDQLRWPDFAAGIHEQSEQVQDGDTKPIEALLMAQALSLQSAFCELSRRAAANMGNDLSVVETYMRLALKAQAQSRATAETLARMKQPREQIVRHVTVHEGGQAVVADQFHHHAGGITNGKANRQPQTVGDSPVAALRGPDPLGASVPIPGNAERPLSNARRSKSRRAEGQ